MKNKKYLRIIPTIIAVALIITVGMAVMPAAREVKANDAIVEGTWLDDITEEDNFISGENANPGSGSQADPHIILDARDLAFLAYYTINYPTEATQKHFALGADIDLAGKNWVPIGNNTTNNAFKGAIDGRGHKIKNLTILDSTYQYTGLVGYSNGLNIFKNIVFEGVYITGVSAQYCGALVGMAKATGQNSLTFEGITISEDSIISPGFPGGYVGGVVGLIELSEGSLNSRDITNNGVVETSVGSYAGGFAGSVNFNPTPQYENTQVYFENIVNNGQVTGVLYAGGITARAYYAKISNSANYGVVDGFNGTGGDGSDHSAGGLIGCAVYGFDISDSFNRGQVHGYKAGGLVGRVSRSHHNSYIINCFNTGAVNADYYAAGLVAEVYIYTTGMQVEEYVDLTLTIEDCYNEGTLETKRDMGGLAGRVMNNLVMRNCRNLVDLEDAHNDVYVGGLVCSVTYGGLEITNCYNIGNINAMQSRYAGGLVGYATIPTNAAYQNKVIKISTSYNLGDIDSKEPGGLIGHLEGVVQIDKSFNMGDITASSTYSGGLIAYLGIRTTSAVEQSYIKKSYNSGMITSGTYPGGIAGYIEFLSTAGTYKELLIQQTFNTSTIFQGTRHGGITSGIAFTNGGPICKVIFDGAFAYNFDNDINFQLNPYISRPSYGEVVNVNDKSRTLTEEELKDQSVYVDAGFDFEADWAMPEAGSTGNNTAPYLKGIGGTTLELIDDGGTQRLYRAAFCEQVFITSASRGKTFTGWRLDENTFFAVGEPIPVLNYPMTLTAEFVPTPYIRIIVEAPGVSSIAAQYIAVYDPASLDDFAQGYYPGVAGDFRVVLDSSSPDYDKFKGWQVFKPEQNGPGYWQTFTGSDEKEFNLKTHDLTNFIRELEPYVVGDYTVVGEIRIRAQKDVRNILITASGATHKEDGDIGTMIVFDMSGEGGAGERVTLDGSWTGMNTVDGATLRLEGIVPIYDYVVSYQLTYTYYEGGVQKTLESTVPAVKNIANITLVAPLTADIDHDIVLDIRPVFARVIFNIEIVAQTKDVVDYTLDTGLMVHNNGDSILVYGSAPNISLAPASEMEIDDGAGGIARIYRFVGFKIYDNDLGDYVTLPDTQGISMAEFAEFLERHSIDGKIQIIAEYAVFYPFSAQVTGGGNLTFTVTDPDGNTQEGLTIAQLDNFYEKGTVIIAEATEHVYYEFDSFYNQSGTVAGEGNLLTIVISGKTFIGARFLSLSYNLTTSAVNNNGGSVIDGATIQILVNNTTGVTEVKIGDVIKLGNVTAPEGFRFGSAEIVGGSVIPLPEQGVTVDNNFLNNFLTGPNITIRVRFIKLYQLSVGIAEGQTGMGNFTVKVSTDGGQTYTETDQTIFDDGTLFEITAAANNHHEFDGFSGVYPTEYEDINNPTKVKFALRASRTITVKFKPVVYTIDAQEQIKGGGTLQVSKNEIVLGDQIVLIFTPEGSNVIKSWKINGKDIKELSKLSNVKVSENSVTITITEEWLETYQQTLQTEIVTGMNDIYFYMIIGVSVAVPVLLAVFIFLFISNLRKRQAIMAELKAAEASRYKMDTSAFLQDLIEGKKAGQITEEQVKEEMKKRKKNK